VNTASFPDTPYKGLTPYEEEDARFFFGRDQDREIIIANLIASRLTVLYGASGVGKSSVLSAGVAHHLRRLAQQNLEEYGIPEFAVAVFKDWTKDPVADLTAKIEEAVKQTVGGQAFEQLLRRDSLVQTIQAGCERLGGDLLIVLDQFEEYFLYHTGEDGEDAFAVEFSRAVNMPGLRVNFLISIREDALSKLDYFKGRILKPFNNRLELKHLNRLAAREAIKKPIEEYNLRFTNEEEKYSIEPKLVEEILNQRTPIETPYLQLVMERLWEEEKKEGSRVLRLETLKRLKGLKSIIKEHVGDAMDMLGPSEQGIAERIFDYLVTPSGTKIAYLASDLARRTKCKPDRLEEILDRLCGQSRILRHVSLLRDSGDENGYELFHDVLAEPILQWQAKHAKDRELAEQNQKLAAAERKAQEQRKRAEEKARQARRLLWLSLALVIMFVLAGATAVYAWRQKNRVERATQEARDQKDRAETARRAAVKGDQFNRDALNMMYESSNQSDQIKNVLAFLNRKTKTKDAILRGITLNNIGGLHRYLGDYHQFYEPFENVQKEYFEAETAFKEAKDTLKPALGRDSYYLGNTLNDLAGVYLYQGKYPEATPAFEQSLDILTEYYRSDDVELTKSLDNLAVCYYKLGKYAEAEQLFKQAQETLEKATPPDPRALAKTLNGLAKVYRDQGRYGEAEELFNKALEIYEREVGSNDPDVALSRQGLGWLYYLQGKYAEAEPYFNRAREIDEKVAGPDGLWTSYDLNFLAELYREQGKYADSEQLFNRAKRVQEKALGPKHPDVADCLNGLGWLYYKMGTYKDAEPLLKRALDIRREALPGSPALTESLNRLAELYRKQQRFAEADNLFK
jgi:tetratricopeptide (TPR) repeat protein